MAGKKTGCCWLVIGVCVILYPGGQTLGQDDVSDVPSTVLSAGEDKNKRYHLIGGYEEAAPAEGFGLIVVVGGGNGGADIESFVKRIYKKALPKNYLVAQLVPVKWTAGQQVLWGTEKVPAEGQEFSTEEFIEAVIEDVRSKYKVNDEHVFTLCWSSGGLAGYAYSLQKDGLATGSFIAMSAFEPERLPPLEQAKGRAYVLFYSATDETYPFAMVQQARDRLKEEGAKVLLLKHRGKESWQEKPYRQIGVGIKCLERDHGEPVKPTKGAGSDGQVDWRGKTGQEGAGSGASAEASSLKMRPVWEISIPDALYMCAGDWNLDGRPEILVCDGDEPENLHVIDSNGREIETIGLPDRFKKVECGRIKGEPALLAYRKHSSSVTVLDRHGKKLWAYQGVHRAHWGDLDGDGNDEMVVGLEGLQGGLHAVSKNGKRLWKVSTMARFLDLSVVSARQNRPATIVGTELEGSVHIFDGTGKRTGTMGMEGSYFIPVQAAEIDSNGTIQILGVCIRLDMSTFEPMYFVAAFDVEGNIAWERRISARTGEASVRGGQFLTAGDLDGDGVFEWVYAWTAKILAIGSAEKGKIATIDAPLPDEMVILSFKNKKGKLVLRKGPKVLCYGVVEAGFSD